MARDFGQIIASATGYQAPIVGVPIKLPEPVDRTIMFKTIPLNINWADYGASTQNPSVSVSVNFDGGASGPALDNIKSIIVDNTFSLNSIYVHFPDTKITYVAPPNSTMQTPVLTAGKRMVVFCEGMQTGAVPNTTIHLLNYEIQPIVSENPFQQPAAINFIANSAFALAVPASSFTFTGVPIGNARADRIIAMTCAFGTEAGIAPPPGVLSLSVNGNLAIPTTNAFDVTMGVNTAIYYLSFATGTVANIDVILSAAVEFGSIGIYNIFNAQNPIPFSVANDLGTIGIKNVQLPMQQGAVGLFSSVATTASAFPNQGWSGVSSVNYADANPLAPNYTIGSGAMISGQNQAGNVSVTLDSANGLCGVAWR